MISIYGTLETDSLIQWRTIINILELNPVQPDSSDLQIDEMTLSEWTLTSVRFLALIYIELTMMI